MSQNSNVKSPKMQKFHRPLLKGLVDGLNLVFQEGRPGSKVLDSIFKKNNKWGSRDRRVFAEVFYEVLRWRYRLSYEITGDVNASAEVLAHYYLQKNNFEVLEAMDLSRYERHTLGQVPLWVRYSFSKDFHEFCKNEVSDLETYYRESQREAPVFIRLNTIKSNIKTLKKELKAASVITTQKPDLLTTGLMLEQRKNVFKLQAFKDGMFEVQDGGSQLIAPFLELEPGQRVIDACAGSGGKSLHIANLLANSGKIIALDIHEWKLKELKKRARRNDVQNIETKVIENQKVIKRLHNTADRLLLDVPCTGSGVFRRKPDSKYRWDRENVQRLLDLQSEILEKYSLMLKPGGKMVYATCSVFPSENQKQVQKFLEKNPDWNLEEEKNLAVGENGFDGFYMARLSKK